MFDLAELHAGILEDFADVQAMVCQVDDIWAERRANKLREYQREWVREKRAKLAKYPPRFCLCCGKLLEPGARRPRLYCSGKCQKKKSRMSENSSIRIVGE